MNFVCHLKSKTKNLHLTETTLSTGLQCCIFLRAVQESVKEMDLLAGSTGNKTVTAITIGITHFCIIHTLSLYQAVPQVVQPLPPMQ